MVFFVDKNQVTEEFTKLHGNYGNDFNEPPSTRRSLILQY